MVSLAGGSSSPQLACRHRKIRSTRFGTSPTTRTAIDPTEDSPRFAASSALVVVVLVAWLRLLVVMLTSDGRRA